MNAQIDSETAMRAYGEQLVQHFHGGEVVELIGDVGSGKTTLVKGIGAGLGVVDDIQSPSFTISRTYDAARGLRLVHYDFYRLDDAGVMAYDVAEVVQDSQTITVVEWAEAVRDVLPAQRLQLQFASPDETTRTLDVQQLGDVEQS